MAQLYAIIELRHPESGRRYGFRARALVFGSIAAGIRYNVFFRLIAALFNRLFGTPPICFFDDCAALLPRLLATKGLAVFTRFFDLLGIRLQSAKSAVGAPITFLGLLGASPSGANDFTLSICLPVETIKAWSALISSYMAQSRMSFQELGKHTGRMSFSQTLLFAKFARTQLRPPLYQAV